MALTIKQYGYYLKGNKLSIVEKDTSFNNNVNNKNFGPGIQRQLWKSPQSSVDNGLEIVYSTSNSNNINDEDSTINLPTYLSKALVYYVKAKVSEDVANIEAKEYFMREFKKMVEKHNNSRIKGPRLIVPGSHAIR
tara:strand:- start:1529 stop:1936 length:408 start_codon:yes stop_codon:yes gene_type:complete